MKIIELKKTPKSKAVFVVTICCFALIVLTAIILGADLMKTSDYRKVRAEIVKISDKNQNKSGNHVYSYFITYEFEFKGEKYQVSKSSLIEIDKKVGDLEEIKINPDNPEEMKTSVLQNTCYFMMGVLMVSIVVLNFPRKDKRQKFYQRLSDEKN